MRIDTRSKGCHTDIPDTWKSATAFKVSPDGVAGLVLRFADHAANVFITLIHNNLDVFEVLFSKVQEIDTAHASTEHADSQLSSSTVEVISNLDVRST